MSIKKYSSGSWVTVPYRKYETATDTITTLPKQIIGDGQSASAVIKGNLSQSGTPTPQNPIQPQECGERTANLCDKASFTIAANDGSKNEVIYNGELDAGTYTVSLNQDNAITGSIRNTFRVTIDGTTIYENASNDYHNNAGQHRFTFTVPTKQTVDVRYWANTLNNACAYSQIMLNTGSTALDYQPFGFQIPILSGGTTTPVYLGEVQSERKIKKYEFTGTENFQNINTSASIFGVYGLFNEEKYIPRSGAFSTHYNYKPGQSDLINIMNNNDFVMFKQSETLYNIAFKDTLYSDRTDFKAYLAAQYAAGTPVTVWYVLATPTTGIVNEPIRKIGNYADSVSATGIPTTGMAESFDIDTDLKPSEVSLTYHGWHEHSDTKF